MITTNPITISTPTRFQVSFDLTPPYTKAEIRVAGDGRWSVQCGLIARYPQDADPQFRVIIVEGAHDIAPHEGEPAPCICGPMKDYGGVEQVWSLTDDAYRPARHVWPMDPVPHGERHFDKMWLTYTPLPTDRTAWRVQVDLIHGELSEVADAHRPKGGCLLPGWWWLLALGRDQAKEEFDRRVRSGAISVGPDVPAEQRKGKATGARSTKRAAPKPKKRRPS
jgi:hypothetical protein